MDELVTLYVDKRNCAEAVVKHELFTFCKVVPPLSQTLTGSKGQIKMVLASIRESWR